MSPAGEWAKEPRTPYRRLVVKSKTGSLHAVSTRHRFGRQITLCGRVIEVGWSTPTGNRLEGKALDCGQCKAILEEPESFRGRA